MGCLSRHQHELHVLQCVGLGSLEKSQVTPGGGRRSLYFYKREFSLVFLPEHVRGALRLLQIHEESVPSLSCVLSRTKMQAALPNQAPQVNLAPLPSDFNMREALVKTTVVADVVALRALLGMCARKTGVLCRDVLELLVVFLTGGSRVCSRHDCCG